MQIARSEIRSRAAMEALHEVGGVGPRRSRVSDGEIFACPQPRRPASALVVHSLAMLARDVSARGARIRFVEAGSGPALVLLHDAFASHEMFLATLAHLSTDFHVVAPDLPGFGASEK